MKPWHWLTAICLVTTSACTTIGYYVQAVSGQTEILVKQQPVQKLVADPVTPEILKQSLSAVMDILDFAHTDLGLPDNGSYRQYADLQRRYVVWNVVAAPEFSLQAKQWCYLVVGCLNYHGYFAEQQARDYASNLSSTGWEVTVNGVSAYSTLGWFRDPLLNSMLNRERWEIARMLFHELAHQLLYFDGDTDFNEAFADSVATIGLQHWLHSQPSAIRETAELSLQREAAFYNLVLTARDRFATLYASGQPATEMRLQKQQLTSKLQTEYRQLQAGWNGDTRYDTWMQSQINNAGFSIISTYRLQVPQFLAAYRQLGSRLPDFYAWAVSLKACNNPERQQYLQNPNQRVTCQSY